jgi:hypothetical protein
MVFRRRPPRLRDGDEKIFVGTGRSGFNEQSKSGKELLKKQQEMEKIKQQVEIGSRDTVSSHDNADRKEMSKIVEKRTFQTIYKRELGNVNIDNLNNEEFQKLLFYMKLRKKFYQSRLKTPKGKQSSKKLWGLRRHKRKDEDEEFKIKKNIRKILWEKFLWKVFKVKVGSEDYFRKLLRLLFFWNTYGKRTLRFFIVIFLFISLVTGYIFNILPFLKFLKIF